MNVTNTENNNLLVSDNTTNNNDMADDKSILASKKQKNTVNEVKEKKPRGQKKGQVGEKTKEALKAGREKLKEKWDEDRKRQEELTQKYAIKKANALIRKKLEIKKKMGCENMDSEEEEPLTVIQPKKPKKKQTIVLPAQSDSEEEVVIKKESKKTTSKPQQQVQQPQNNVQSFGPRIVFY